MSADAEPRSPTVEAVIEGNHLRLIDDGPERLSELLALIDGAQISLKFYFYMFQSDDCGEAVMDRLLAALARGVNVALMVDCFGSADADRGFFEPFQAAGGQFGMFSSRRSTRYLIRNHQKFAIADSKRLMMGGFNISNQYFGTPDNNCWHDLGLLLEGPQTAELERWFDALQQWVMADKQRYARLSRMIRDWQGGNGAFSWLIGGPVRRLNPWAQSAKRDLERGRRCDMIQAYFSPSRGMLRRIGKVGMRGQVRIVTASLSDNSTTIAAARSLYSGLFRHRVRIFEYLPCKLHMKLIVIDDIVYIGSANFDMRSLFINLELMLRIEDAGFAAQMREFVTRETANCQEITSALHRERTGVLARFLGRISYVLVGALDYTVTRRLNLPMRLRIRSKG